MLEEIADTPTHAEGHIEEEEDEEFIYFLGALIMCFSLLLSNLITSERRGEKFRPLLFFHCSVSCYTFAKFPYLFLSSN